MQTVVAYGGKVLEWCGRRLGGQIPRWQFRRVIIATSLWKTAAWVAGYVPVTCRRASIGCRSFGSPLDGKKEQAVWWPPLSSCPLAFRGPTVDAVMLTVFPSCSDVRHRPAPFRVPKRYQRCCYYYCCCCCQIFVVLRLFHFTADRCQTSHTDR